MSVEKVNAPVHIKDVLKKFVDGYPQLKEWMDNTIQCPDCGEGVDKCLCDNGVPIG